MILGVIIGTSDLPADLRIGSNRIAGRFADNVNAVLTGATLDGVSVRE
jgi:hypothetical protein